MHVKMKHTARAELAEAIRRRYRSASSKEKRKILEEFVATTGYHEKSAIRVLNAEPIIQRRQRRNRPSLYDEAARAALIVLWEASDRVCSKQLKALMPILLPALERHGHLRPDSTIRSKILAMSAATIDRLLWAARNATRSKKVAVWCRRCADACRCEPLPIGTSRCPAAWKWTRSLIAGKPIAAAISTAWF